jgi:putative IMPACT (imprinted ancient) family translation regulator
MSFGGKELNTLLVLHFNRRLTTAYSETTAHCNGNFGTDNQIYVECV